LSDGGLGLGLADGIGGRIGRHADAA
jgi:hypothetical protein